jgi:gamma-D-glutamyl-L-lysine dipeptidyl-peptidase
MRSLRGVALFGLTLIAGLLTGPSIAAASPAAAPPAAPAATAPPARWIAVSVATLWVSPRLARPIIDALACSNPANPRGWVAGMTVDQKRWLVGKLETQALYGTRVFLLGTSGAWSHVLVTTQSTPRDARGYPGWLPTVQLTSTPPKTSAFQAVLRRRTVWAYTAPDWRARVVELSYATRLPAMTWSAAYVGVQLLNGRRVYMPRASVALHQVGVAWPRLSGATVVAEAKRFLGLKYLWAGTSGFGYDCSGFTEAVFFALGKTISRDAGAQYAHGVKVTSRAALLPGDLVFFRNSTGIHHVGMYVGAGKMIHSPGTGQAVTITSLSVAPYAAQFAGGRRYTP